MKTPCSALIRSNTDHTETAESPAPTAHDTTSSTQERPIMTDRRQHIRNLGKNVIVIIFKGIDIILVRICYVTYSFLYFFSLWLDLTGASLGGDDVCSGAGTGWPSTVLKRTQSSDVLKSECISSNAIKTEIVNLYYINRLRQRKKVPNKKSKLSDLVYLSLNLLWYLFVDFPMFLTIKLKFTT